MILPFPRKLPFLGWLPTRIHFGPFVLDRITKPIPGVNAPNLLRPVRWVRVSIGKTVDEVGKELCG